eukprot:IDg195t1
MQRISRNRVIRANKRVYADQISYCIVSITWEPPWKRHLTAPRGKTMARQEHYRIGKARARRRRRLQLLSLAVQADASPELVFRCLRRAQEAKEDVHNISARALYI